MDRYRARENEIERESRWIDREPDRSTERERERAREKEIEPERNISQRGREREEDRGGGTRTKLMHTPTISSAQRNCGSLGLS